MNILHVIDYFQPNLGYQEVYLAREQLRLGHNVTVITSDRFAPHLRLAGADSLQMNSGGLSRGYKLEDGIPVFRLPVKFETQSRVWLSSLFEIMQQLRADAVHIHRYLTISSLRIAVARRMLPDLHDSAVFVVDDHLYEEASISRLKSLYPLVRQFYSPLMRQSTDHFVAVSSATKDFMLKNYGLNDDEISIIPLGVDTNIFKPNPEARSQVRQSLNFGDEDFICIFTGRIEERKRVEVLLKSIQQLANEFENLKLVIVGYSQPGYLSKLKKLAESIGIGQRVKWCAPVSNQGLAEYFAASDVAIWPAGHSISFMEAMACALPLIVSDSAKTAEDVAHDNGFTYQEGDVDAISTCIRHLLSNRDLRIQMGAKGYSIALEMHSWRGINEKFMSLYKQKGVGRTTDLLKVKV